MNKAQKALVAFGAGVTLLWGGAVLAPAVAGAIPPGPNTCVGGGGGFIGYGGYEDCDLWADGSFWHRQWGSGPFAFGSSSGRVCDGMPPVPTDNDPRTPCPGVVMP
ncbi:hypothetical protein SEA_WALELIANO_50 [Mycobacterium phage Waleliano]|uniref:Uncharacterized protein n=4 Tax=Coopervirus TaxID=1982898 RepID=A0A345KWL2_9CAUD|nr:hypothetical protein AVV09_gp52 [Mycobacterium phage BrownCNA]YP_009614474.1 hypothetical protein FDI64_gp51 [Mycobacterium phage Zemanar]AXH47414.1 hypothetical protein SEA_HANGMAN_50 [Mycobacterium phage Hangman]QBI96119.1 hypothetical protein SEA_WALELIANO_50 [Mycobacterium phage Waleliano]AEJ95725.1 hypothetical protein ZEMANAR_51 [Mycobacterium phage Zemanar]AKY02765.1 hypothetical protein SEA_BROWNCNA_52 [Mycobacterium phage BrownCNA]